VSATLTPNSHNAAAQLFERAQKVIPGGVNSPVRAFGSVGGIPRFISQASGAYIHDTEGKQYIDYVGSWGPMLLGHAHPEVIAAVQVAAEHGLSFGAPTELEVQMAEPAIPMPCWLRQAPVRSHSAYQAHRVFRLTLQSIPSPCPSTTKPPCERYSLNAVIAWHASSLNPLPAT